MDLLEKRGKRVERDKIPSAHVFYTKDHVNYNVNWELGVSKLDVSR